VIASGLSLSPEIKEAVKDTSALSFKDKILTDSTGKRFVAEDTGIGSVVTNAAAIREGTVFAIFDSSNADVTPVLGAALASGKVFKGETIEELAAAAGIDPRRIQEDIAVTMLPFDTSAKDLEAKVAAKEQRTTLMTQGGKYLFAAMLIFGFLFIIRSMYRSALNSSAEGEYAVVDAHTYQMLPQRNDRELGEQYASGIALPDTHEAGAEHINDAPIRNLEPQRIARVIRGLMNDER
jgi:flagellar biosynthesis/type III secretory pathway M-ring protein FliF/YscJ